MRRNAKIGIGWILAFCTISILSSPARGDTTATEKPLHVLVVAVASDQLSLDVTGASSTACDLNAICNVMHLIVTDNVVKDQLKQLRKGDHIQIVYSTETKTPADIKNTDASHAPEAQGKDNSKDAKDSKDPKSKDSKSKDSKNSSDAKESTEATVRYVLKAWCVDSMPPPPLSRAWVLIASAGVCLLLTLIFSGFRPTQLVIGEDNRYSNSRFQMALWFFVLTATYIATLWLRVWWAGWDFIGGVDIPKNLLLLSGMSALTFGGAKGITASKSATPGATVPKTRAATPNFFLDLTHNDGVPAAPAQPAVDARAAVGEQPAVAARAAVSAQPAVSPQFDFGDFQMVVITLIAVATYIVLIFNFFGTVEYSKVVTLPDVDTTLLAAFGLGQGAYLTKKAVGNVGTS